MGQQTTMMNPAAVGTGTKSSARAGYNQKALAEIRNSLQPYANENGSSAASTISSLSTTSGVSSASSSSGHTMGGYTEDISSSRPGKLTGELLGNKNSSEITNGANKNSTGLSTLSSKLIRKPSLERELSLHRGSPALDGTGSSVGGASSRSDSPQHPQLARQYSPSSFAEPPPPPPPRAAQQQPPPTPPPPAPTEFRAQQFPYVPSQVPTNVQHLLKRMSPVPVGVPSRPSQSSTPQRGTSPVSIASSGSGSRQPMVVQNGPQVQQQLNQQMQALSIYHNHNGVAPSLQSSSGGELPPPYPVSPPAQSVGVPASTPSPTPKLTTPPPPSYTASMQNRQSPTQPDFRKSPAAAVFPSSGAAPPPTSSAVARPTPLQAWGARQAKTQPPIIMQSVKSTQVQKPVLQTAIAPTSPPVTSQPPPSYPTSVPQKQPQIQYASPGPPSPIPPPSFVSVPTTEPPSYAQALASQRGLPPPPPYPPEEAQVSTVESIATPRPTPIQQQQQPMKSPPPQPPPPDHQPLQRKFSPSPQAMTACVAAEMSSTRSESPPVVEGSSYKTTHQSPIPERKHTSKEKEEERQESKVRNYSPQAFKFYMEQHIENVIKSHQQRLHRRRQLETEMDKIGLSPEAQCQMRKMLSQKESNYIRLKRAKMDKSMFTKIIVIGIGAFGEVALVRKLDTNHLYAMKTLRKTDVLKRNQVAHVKAERDILAEADNEWVVKLYYSFQDKENLYFVMDYIPGGDLMSLLIKFGIFQEPLARFYIAELTCAVESVHRMGFIHRDIKPDNILIDRDGHIKLTDFGLCTGFRWTHNSKYYQHNGEHGRQDSMDLGEEFGNSSECRCYQLKPLERRRRREHQRCLAHSLVGTPNYIAPEVLQRTGYTQMCDWWSVGVILYEMLVGQPPFLANTPAETQYKVINWERNLRIPREANLSPEAEDLILKLCAGADRRLGKNAAEVKNHGFFRLIDFDKGLRRQPPPYIPKIQFSTDTSNFDPVDPEKLRTGGSSEAEPSDCNLDDNNKCYHGFLEFTFRRFFDDGGSYPTKISLDDNDNQGPVYV